MQTTLLAPCSACPFRTGARPGQIGTEQARRMMARLGHESVGCRATSGSDRPESCAGAALFLTTGMTLARNRVLAQHQRALKTADRKDQANVFTSADAFIAHHTTMKTRLRRPCRQCPFRTDAPPGWLGPWDAPTLLANIRQIGFPCHRTITAPDQALDDPALESCAGAALFLNARMTLARDPALARHQELLRKRAAPDTHRVFTSDAEFIDHHCNGLAKLAERGKLLDDGGLPPEGAD